MSGRGGEGGEPTPRAPALLAALSLAAFLVPLPLAALAALALLAAVAADARAARRAPAVERSLPAVLARGVPVPLRRGRGAPSVRVRLRQAVPPGMALEPAEADGALDAASCRAARPPRAARGRHALDRAARPRRLAPPPGRAAGRLRLSRPARRPPARASVRHGRFRDQGITARGPLGLGTEFELVRDYLPDDDVRQVNWRATARMGRPMSNQYRTSRTAT